MKKEFITLLFIIGILLAPSYAAANEKSNSADPLKTALDNLIEQCGVYGSTVNYSAYVSDNSSSVKEEYEISSIECDKSNQFLKSAIDMFMSERDSGYSFVYVEPSQDGDYEVKLSQKTLPVRTKEQIMWMISKKNPDDPRLIDVYALTLSEGKGKAVKGTVYIITKQRSDLPQNSYEGMGSRKLSSSYSDAEWDKSKATLTAKIEGYQMIVEDIKKEIGYLRELYSRGSLTFTEMNKRTIKLCDKLEAVNATIETLIEQYVKSIK